MAIRCDAPHTRDTMCIKSIVAEPTLIKTTQTIRLCVPTHMAIQSDHGNARAMQTIPDACFPDVSRIKINMRSYHANGILAINATIIRWCDWHANIRRSPRSPYNQSRYSRLFVYILGLPCSLARWFDTIGSPRASRTIHLTPRGLSTGYKSFGSHASRCQCA